MTQVQPYTIARNEKRPETAEQWRPYFEEAYKGYKESSTGRTTTYNVRNLFDFMFRLNPARFPEVRGEMDETHIRKLLYGFLRSKFGFWFDGEVYVEHKSVGRSWRVEEDKKEHTIKITQVG